MTALLQEAVERAERKARSDEAIGRILSRMDERPILSQAEIDDAREDGPP